MLIPKSKRAKAIKHVKRILEDSEVTKKDVQMIAKKYYKGDTDKALDLMDHELQKMFP